MTSTCLAFSGPDGYPWASAIAGFVVVISLVIENTLKGVMLKCDIHIDFKVFPSIPPSDAVSVNCNQLRYRSQLSLHFEMVCQNNVAYKASFALIANGCAWFLMCAWAGSCLAHCIAMPFTHA